MVGGLVLFYQHQTSHHGPPVRSSLSADGVRPGRDGVVALSADRPGELAPRVLAGFELVEHVAEVVAGPPAEFGTGAFVDVHAVDRGEHRPAAPRVLRLLVREEPPNDRGRVLAKTGEIAGRERRGGADDVLRETGRGRVSDGEQVSIN